MDHLKKLESKSIYIIREAYKKFKNVAMLWSVGKDSVLEDSELYYKINGKLKRGTIKQLYEVVTPKKTYKKEKKEFIIPKEKVEVLTVKGKTQKEAKVKFGRITTLVSHITDKDIYDITLQTKRNIKTTGDHSLIAAYSDKRGLKLKPIECRKLDKSGGVFCLNDFNFDVKDIKKYKNIVIKDWLLILSGLWLADGCYAANRKIVISTGKNQGILKFLRNIPRIKTPSEKIAKELKDHPKFNGKSLKMDLARKLSKKHNVSFWSAYDSKKRMRKLLNKKNEIYVRVTEKGDAWLCSKKLVERLKKLGFKGTGNNKIVPPWIYSLSNRQISLFLAGYFAGDGSCWKRKNRPKISFSGMNKQLVKGIRPLLLRLGISHGFSASDAKSSGFRTKNEKLYQIFISSAQSIRNFLRNIPDIANKLKKAKVSWEAKSKYQLSSRKVKKVKKVPRQKRKVYDLEVEDTHNFIANGIVCHNSTTMLWLAKKAFFGRIPFPVIYIDTGKHFQEMYDFRDECVKKWDLNLITSDNIKEAKEKNIGPKDKLKCCTVRKTNALKKTIAKHNFDALFLGIRRDEHGVRSKERFFSPRNKDFRWDYKNQAPELWDQYKSQKETEQHLRIHPILDWTEIDVWKYIERENLPVNELYFAKNKKRYRSLGCKPCTEPVKSNAKNIKEIIKEIKESKTAERAGRAQDKEEAQAMQKLRALGYMVLF